VLENTAILFCVADILITAKPEPPLPPFTPGDGPAPPPPPPLLVLPENAASDGTPPPPPAPNGVPVNVQ
jgi:hypothetical protein